MEPHFTKPLQNNSPRLNSLNSSNTLSGSHPNSPRETLGGAEQNYTHWAEPWTGMAVQKPLADNLSLGAVEERKSYPDWTDTMPSTADLQVKPSVSALPPYYRSLHSVGAGLENLGNTCFLNSVLQCFTHMVPLIHGIMSFNHNMIRPYCSEGFCVLCALRQHIEVSLLYTNRVVNAQKFVDNLNYFSSGFERYQQEDAHEFLQCFLDKLDSCCDDLILNDAMCSGNNFVKEVFGGRLLSRVQCCNCGHCSDTYEPSIDFSLGIDDADSLYTALDSFTKVEKIEDPEIKFTCEKCKEQVAVQKQLMLDQVPSVAAFHLKRFKNDGSVLGKIDKLVAFPPNLDLKPYTACDQHNNVELKYDLCAVVVHNGISYCSGHYYCFIRSADDAWFKFDDPRVVQVSEEHVLTQEAYVLFYVKQGTPWFSSFMETQKPYIDAIWNDNSPKSVLDNAEGSTSSSSVLLNCGGDVIETSDGTEEVFTETCSGPIGCKTDNGEDKENKAPVTNSSACVPSHEAVDSASESTLRENISNEGFVEVEVVEDVTTKTPIRSSSPEIYWEDHPESTFSISCGHLRSAENVSCKRQLNKDLENFEMKQACTLIKKNIPGSRGQQLLQAMRGSLSEGSLNKKRSRPRQSEGCPNKKSRPWQSEGSPDKKRSRPRQSEGSPNKKKSKPWQSEGSLDKKRSRPRQSEGSPNKKRSRPRHLSPSEEKEIKYWQ